MRDGIGGRTGCGKRGRGFAGKAGEILLDGLKFSNRTMRYSRNSVFCGITTPATNAPNKA